MTTSGFWTGGPDENRRAMEKHIAVLQTRLDICEPDERQQIARELGQAVEDLKKSSDDQILW